MQACVQLRKITQKRKRQPTEKEKILETMQSTRASFPKCTDSSYNSMPTKQPSQNWGDLNRYFSQEDMQMAKKHMKRCSKLEIIRELQIKITMRYHLAPVRKAITKKFANNRCWRECGEKAAPIHCWWGTM